ncbi:FAD-dependent oxidoreductase [soil metagenome]
MSQTLGTHAIVVGAGMGGLAAAAALSPFFTKVTVLDKDSLPDGAEARLGAGQSAHAHQLLKGGELALEGLLPGFRDALLAAGAVELQAGSEAVNVDPGGELPPCDVGFTVTCLSRPAYEMTLRSCVAALGNIELRGDTPVERVMIENGRAVGVDLGGGDVLAGELIIDASGMNAPLAGQLIAEGEAEFETEAVKINVAYTTQRFARSPAYAGERLGFFLRPGGANARFGFLLPIENNQWIVSLGARGASAVPRDLDGFLDCARQVGHAGVIDRLGEAEAVGEAKTFRKTYATRRRFGAAAKWPDRLIPIGDAMTSFNPTFGQGMSVAACQAAAFASILAERAAKGDGLDGLGGAYFPLAEGIAGGAWTLAINVDYQYPETEGERPANFAQISAFGQAFRYLAATDEEMSILRLRIGHMLESPAKLRESPHAEKLAAAMKAVSQPA